jgi:hypothetical protein
LSVPAQIREEVFESGVDDDPPDGVGAKTTGQLANRDLFIAV